MKNYFTKLLLFFVFIILFSTAIAADGPVIINPQEPTDSDFLTCVLGGDSDANPNVNYHWSKKYSGDTHSGHVLSFTQTSPNEEWTCTVTALFGGAYIGEDTVTIEGDPVTGVISITPEEPYDDDSLTCLIGGSSTPNPNVYYTWTVDSSSETHSGNVLSHTHTEPDQTWTCTVTALFGGAYIGEDSVLILDEEDDIPDDPENEAPTFDSIDNQWTWEDTQPDFHPANADLINLDNYADDSDGDSLTYTLLSQSNSDLINCHLTGLRDRVFSCDTPALNEVGTTIIRVRAYDGEDYSNVEQFNVEVRPVNDVPVIQEELFQWTWEDTQPDFHNLDVDQINLFDYTTDVEGDYLFFELISQSNTDLINCNIIGNLIWTPFGIIMGPAHYIVCGTPAQDATGTTELVIGVSDEDLGNSMTFTLEVRPDNDGPSMDIPDQYTPEDTYPVFNPLNLDIYSTDIDTPFLSYGMVSQSNTDLIDCYLNGTSNRYFMCNTPALHQTGSSTITLSVTDGEFTYDEAFDVIVTPVNDAPVALFEWDPANPELCGEFVVVAFDGTASYDPDGDEIISHMWDLDGDGITETGGSIVVHLFTELGDHNVTLVVSDGTENGSLTQVVTIENCSDNNLTGPVAILNVTPNMGDAPLDTVVDGSASYDTDGGYIMFYSYDYGNGNNTGFLSGEPVPTPYTYINNGTYLVTLTVIDNDGLSATDQEVVVVGDDFMCYDPDEDGYGIGPDCLGPDNCFWTYNPDQNDIDGDGIGDVCDNCIFEANPDQADSNDNGIGDACEGDGNESPIVWLNTPVDGMVFDVGSDIDFTYFFFDDLDLYMDCTFYNDISGTFEAVETHEGHHYAVDQATNFTSLNTFSAFDVPEGTYNWNVECTDNNNNSVFAPENFMFIVSDSIDPNGEMDVSIIAEPNSGEAPLVVNFEPVIHGGQAPYTFNWHFGDGNHESDEVMPTYTYDNNGEYFVRLKVTDFNGQVAYASTIIDVHSAMPEPRGTLWIKRLGVWGTDGFEKTVSGSEVFVIVSIENLGRKDLNDLKMNVAIPELGVRRVIGPFDLHKKDTLTKSWYMPLPEALPGEYDVRVIVGNEDIVRAKHRYMYIVE